MSGRSADRREGPPAVLYVVDKMVCGGGPIVCQQLVQSLRQTPYEPCVVTLFGKGKIGEELAAAGVPLLSLDMRRPFHLRQIFGQVPRIVSFARSHRVVLVHAHLTASGLYGGLAARALGIPGVFTMHGQWPQSWLWRVVLTLIGKLFNALVAVSRATAEQMRPLVQVVPRHLLHIYNGIDTDYWQACSRMARAVGSEGISIAMVANYFAEKDHVTLVAAFGMFRKKYPDSRLVLVGEGEGRPAVEQMVADAGLEGVVFLGEETDIRAVLQDADIFALATLSEGFGLAAIEAMAMELPVVASGVGGLREIITSGTDGVLVPPRDPLALCAALERIAADENLRRRLGVAARRRVESSFSLRAMIGAYHHLYGELV